MIRIYLAILLCMSLAESKATGFTIVDTNICVGTKFVLKDTSTKDGLTIISREWSIGGIAAPGYIQTTSVDSAVYTLPAGEAGRYLTAAVIHTYSDNSKDTWYYPDPFHFRSLPQAMFASIQDTITCPGVTLNFSVTSSPGANDGYPLSSWRLEYGDGNGVNFFTANDAAGYAYTATGNYTVTYQVIDQLGCINLVSQKILVKNNPVVTFVPINPRCRDSVVTYENRTPRKTDIGWTWNWRFIDSNFIKGSLNQDTFIGEINGTDNNMDANHVHIFSTALTSNLQKVILYGQDIHRCFDYDTQIFKVDTTPILVITPSIDTTICFGESIKYTIRGSDTLFYSDFKWGNKINGDSIVLFTPLNTMTYKVYGKTPQCPPAGKDIKIRVVPQIATVTTINPSAIVLGSKAILKLDTKGAVYDSIRWNPDNSLADPKADSTGASPKVSTMYRGRVYYSVDKYVCYHDDSVFLKVDSACAIDSLKIPTAFTPNGDNLNDEFYIKSFALKRINSFNVYNRWGDKVFNLEQVPADDKVFGWNGKKNNNGDDMPPGVYIYNISAQCKNDQTVNFQGEVTIIR